MAYPPWLVIAALSLAARVRRESGWVGVVAACVGGVLVDIDHAVDWLAGGGRINYKVRIILPLHGWELPIAVLLSSRCRGPSWVGPLIAAWIGHLFLDWLTNNPTNPLVYLLSRRIFVGFDRQRAGWPPPLPDPMWRSGRYYWAPLETIVAIIVSMLVLSLFDRRRPTQSGFVR